MNASALRRSRGFTLVELLVAVFIAIIIFGIGFSILNGVMIAKKQTEARMRYSESARMFFEMFERDLSGAYGNSLLVPAPYRAKLAQPGVSGVNDTLVEFSTTVDSNSQAVKGCDYVAARYYVLASTGVLYRKLSATGFPAAPADEPDSALFADVTQFHVDYLQWNESTKSYVAVADPNIATHLDVMLKFTDPEQKIKAPMNSKVYWKRIPIPASMP